MLPTALLFACLAVTGRSLPTAHAATFTVDLTTDQSDLLPGDGICGVVGSGCTLRAAIQEANASAGHDLIAFNIPGGGVQTIGPLSELPDITAPVTIDGTTQSGYAGSPLIELSGVNVGGFPTALKITAGDSAVRGLVINRWSYGIHISGPGGNTISANYIGPDSSGTSDPDMGEGIGVWVDGSPGNLIGGETEASRNLISGVRNGVRISGAGSSGNSIAGNFIGTDASGATAIPNDTGVEIEDAPGNTIGGSSPGSAT